jgi:hypothetical protein
MKVFVFTYDGFRREVDRIDDAQFESLVRQSGEVVGVPVYWRPKADWIETWPRLSDRCGISVIRDEGDP